MGFGRTNICIGASSPLNFAVKQYTTTPTGAAAENTIGIVTDTAITSYSMQAEQPLLRSGNKNLQVYPFASSTVSVNGLNFTDNADGSVSVSGTSTASTNYYFSRGNTGTQILLPKGTYTLSGCPTGTGAIYTLRCNEVDGNKSLAVDSGNGATFTIEKDTAVFVYFFVISGATLNGIVIRPQLEKGSRVTSFVKGDATGQVWIQIGNSSSASFWADKKQTVKVYPVKAMQYIGGSWVSHDALCYLNGAWTEWMPIFYSYGAEIVGWTVNKTNLITKTSNSIVYSGAFTNTNDEVLFRTTESVDLTDIRTLNFLCDVNLNGTWNGYKYLGVRSTVTGSYVASTTLISNGSSNGNGKTLSIDVSSLTGNHYIVVSAKTLAGGTGQGTFNLYKVWGDLI